MSSSSELFKVYEDYSKTLRAWLVAYGVGAPVLFLTNQTIVETFMKSGQARSIALLFIIGVGLQILLAALNKNVMWICYYAEDDPEFQKNLVSRIATWISRQYWIDLCVDVATIALFGTATWRAFGVFVGK